VLLFRSARGRSPAADPSRRRSRPQDGHACGLYLRQGGAQRRGPRGRRVVVLCLVL